jgi:hypothetical protein
MSRRGKRWTSWLAGALIVSGLAISGSGELRAQGSRDKEMKIVRGKVERMTTAPKGEVDGAVLDDGTVLHWPPHLADRFAEVAKKGAHVTADGILRTGPEGDTRLEVRTLTNTDTDATVRNDEPGPKGKRPKGPPPPRSERIETIRGTVARLTTAPKGEVDGAVLDDGTVLHWPPHLEVRFSKVVKKGDRIEASGSQEKTAKGDEHFEVASITNLDTKATAENEDARGPADARPPRDRERGDRDDDRDHEIREIKKELERLLRRVERLEREGN